MDFIYLTVDDVIDLHTEAIEQFGGVNGLRSNDLLESAVFQPQQSAFGEDAYPSFSLDDVTLRQWDRPGSNR